MKKILVMAIYSLIFIFYAISSYTITSAQKSDLIEKIRMTEADLPEGFIFGKIPNFAKSVILSNPWDMDRNAINKLTDHIYPNGDSSAVDGIYMSIMTRSNQPFGDDLVCYAIVYKDAGVLKKEVLKIEDFVKNNRDRVILFTKENFAVLLHVDDANDFHFISKLARSMEEKLR